MSQESRQAQWKHTGKQASKARQSVAAEGWCQIATDPAGPHHLPNQSTSLIYHVSTKLRYVW